MSRVIVVLCQSQLLSWRKRMTNRTPKDNAWFKLRCLLTIMKPLIKNSSWYFYSNIKHIKPVFP